MCREVDTYELTFLVKTFYGTPLLCLGRLGLRYLHGIKVAEESIGGLSLGLLVLLAVALYVAQEVIVLNGLHILFAFDAEAVEGTSHSHALQRLPVHGRGGHTLHQVVDITVGAVLLALLDNGVGSCLAHALDGSKTKAYLTVLIHTEVGIRLIDIGAIDMQPQSFAFVHELRNFLDVGAAARQKRGHEFGRIVCLEVSRLVGHP